MSQAAEPAVEMIVPDGGGMLTATSDAAVGGNAVLGALLGSGFSRMGRRVVFNRPASLLCQRIAQSGERGR